MICRDHLSFRHYICCFFTARWVSENELLVAGTLSEDVASDLRGQKDVIVRAIRSALPSLMSSSKQASTDQEDECEIDCISDVWVTDDARSIVREYEVKFKDGDGTGPYCTATGIFRF